MSLDIRPERPADHGHVADLLRAAFGEEGETIVPLVEAIRQAATFRGQAYVAVDAGEIVGHTMLTWGWIDAARALVECPVLSPLAVAPSRHGTGIGRALVAHAVAAAEAAGAPGVVLEGDPAYYGRLGFESAEDSGVLRPSTALPDGAFQWVRCAAYEPWMQRRFVYPDVFWRYDAVGLRAWRLARQTGLTWTTTTLGARDPKALAAFYGRLLGWGPVRGDDDWYVVGDPGGGRALAAQLEPDQVPPAGPAGPGDQHMQAHLEILADDLDAGVEHALACGATLAPTQPRTDIRVLLDPEGHPFCVFVER